MRPQEVPRLEGWNDIHLDEDLRIIEVNKAKGGRSRRNAEISEPLWRILVWCKERGLALNYYSTRKFNRIRRNAGLFDLWEKDLLRHTYASHHYALHKDVKTLISSMGNSERVLFQNYIRPRPRSEAILLFGLILHWNAPQQTSQVGRRIDRLFARPPAQLSLDDLRLLRTRIAGELAKVERRHDAPAERDTLAAKLESLVNELRSRSAATESTTSHEPNNSLDHDARLSA